MESDTIFNKSLKQFNTAKKPEDDRIEKCNYWLKRCSINDECSSLCSESTSSSEYTENTNNSAMDSGFIFQNSGVERSNVVESENVAAVDLNQIGKSPSNYIDKINIYKSKKVHIGDVTYIQGPIYINNNPIGHTQMHAVIYSPKGNFSVVSRTNWLAQPPEEERTYLLEPAKFVIICHSATEEGSNQAENTLLVRVIQQFHIESRKWSDISYNFLIGSDGTVFEGRGWGVQGAHTIGYNKHSVAICFIGCFVNHSPPAIALERAKALIQHGIKIGMIRENYSLLGHGQCNSFESPGRKLFEEIKTWDNWDSTVNCHSPSPLIFEN